MQSKTMTTLTVREYAREEGITLQSVYRRIWQSQIQAQRIYGRWLISTQAARHEDDSSAVQNRKRARNRTEVL